MDEPSRSPIAVALVAASLPRFATCAAFPNRLAQKPVGANPVHRLLLRACFEGVIHSLSRERTRDEQLPRPSLLNLATQNDIHFRRRDHTAFGKEESMTPRPRSTGAPAHGSRATSGWRAGT